VKARPVTAEIRASLEQLEESGLDQDSGDLLVVLAWLVREQVQIPDEELNAARRRAMFVLAAGGDPHRDLALDSVAAERLAAELDTPERRAHLAHSLEELQARAVGLPTVLAAVETLHAEPDLAWRTFALALLADEIADE
jgi:hypothetical protein